MKKAHFIGISGAGMSAVAVLLKERGYAISGSDEGFYPPISQYLLDMGIAYAPCYRAENIPADADFIVIGKHAKLVPEENQEVRAAFESGIPVRSFPEVLAEASALTENIVVAGSFGKSTTTALIAWALVSAGKDPSYFIGALPRTPQANAHAGKGSLFVLEGDEYPASNWELRSKFLYLAPRDILITSLAHDHLNIFPTLESYLAPFEALAGRRAHGGLIVAQKHAENMEGFLRGKDRVVTYGVTGDEEWSAQNIAWGERTSFDLVHEGKTIVRIDTELLGIHNIENITGAAALLLSRQHLTPEEFASVIASFKGLTRRLDRKSEKTRIPIYEGFGSSLPKAESAIAALRQHFPEKRLLIVFEPHTFSWRNREALPWYDAVFSEAEKVFIYKPPEHGSSTHAQLSLEEISSRVRNAGVAAVPFEDPDKGLSLIGDELLENDVVLLLTSGDLGGLIERLPKLAEERFPA